MTTTHVGKIGRLPCRLRDELGRRLENGRPGREIVQWLNRQPEVRETLKTLFDGHPVTEQNLSQWRQTGHLEWLRRQEARWAARDLSHQARDLEAAADGACLADRFATVLASEMTQLAATLLEAPSADPEQRWTRLCQINRELSLLRREDHRAGRLAIQRERWQAEHGRDLEAQAEDRREKQEQRRMQTLLTTLRHPVELRALQAISADSGAPEVADLMDRITRDQPGDPLLKELDDLGARLESSSGAPAKTPQKTQKSNLFQPNPPSPLARPSRPCVSPKSPPHSPADSKMATNATLPTPASAPAAS